MLMYVIYRNLMEDFSCLKRKEILTLVTTWKNLEDIMLCDKKHEASPKRTNAV